MHRGRADSASVNRLAVGRPARQALEWPGSRCRLASGPLLDCPMSSVGPVVDSRRTSDWLGGSALFLQVSRAFLAALEWHVGCVKKRRARWRRATRKETSK